MVVREKEIFNLDSTEKYQDAKVMFGNPNGIINFERTPHKWAFSLFKKMCERTWFPGHVNISKDKVDYTKLSYEQKRAYDLVLAQLIANDSIQANQLADKINSYITSTVVNACIGRQVNDELIHSHSYSIMAEEICQDTDRIFDMHNRDEELMIKNKAVQNMYLHLYKEDNQYEPEDLLLACVANQILEELVFPGGFAIMLSYGELMRGSQEMIKEIMKDETLSHVPLFKNIFRSAIKESFNGIVPDIVKEKALKMILEMEQAELRWTKYASKGLPGFSDEVIEVFLKSRVNNICDNLLLDKPYPEIKPGTNNPLGKLLRTNLPNEEMGSKANFLEGVNSVDYTQGGLELGDF